MQTPLWSSICMNLSNNAGFVECKNGNLVQFGKGEFTIESWIYLDDATGANWLICKSASDSHTQKWTGEYAILIDNGSVAVLGSVQDSFWTSLLQTEQILITKTWHHVAVTMATDGKASLYVDGFLKGSKSVSPGQIYEDIPLIFGGYYQSADGRNPAGVPGFKGLIGRLRYWDSCHDAYQIWHDAMHWDPSHGTPLADFDFGKPVLHSFGQREVSFQIAKDGHFCECTPGLSFNPTKNYMDFPYADVGYNPEISFGGRKPYTIEGWIYPQELFGTIISKYSYEPPRKFEGEYRVYFENSRLTSFRSTPPYTISQESSTIPINNWSHFATSYDGSTLRLYVNGNQVASGEFSDKLTSYTRLPTLIGAIWVQEHGKANRFNDGLVQVIRIWRTCLSGEDIVKYMRAEPSEDDIYLVANFDFGTPIPHDTTGINSISLHGGPQFTFIRNRIAPSQAVPSSLDVFLPKSRSDELPEFPSLKQPKKSRKQIDFTSREFYEATLEEVLARLPADASEAMRQDWIERFNRVFNQEREKYENDPLLIQPVYKVVGNGEAVYMYHTCRGEVEFIRIPESMTDACTEWWIKFLAELTLGFFSSLELLPPTGTVAGKMIARRVLANPQLLKVIENIVESAGDKIEWTVVIEIFTELRKEHVIWPIIKIVFFQAGWLSLLWLLEKLIEFISLPEAEVPIIIAKFAMFAVKLTTLASKYNDNCGIRAD